MTNVLIKINKVFPMSIQPIPLLIESQLQVLKSPYRDSSSPWTSTTGDKLNTYSGRRSPATFLIISHKARKTYKSSRPTRTCSSSLARLSAIRRRASWRREREGESGAIKLMRSNAHATVDWNVNPQELCPGARFTSYVFCLCVRALRVTSSSMLSF